MTITVTTTPVQDAEISRRWAADRQAGHTKAATAEEFVADLLQDAIRQWQVQTLGQQLSALAPAALEHPHLVQEFIASLGSKAQAR